MQERIRPVVLSGGSGTRLWPLSRPEYPKQFLPGLAAPGESLFSATLRRVADADRFAPPLILCNQAHRRIVDGEARRAGIAPGPILIEPAARNTAPAVAAALRYVLREKRDALLAILPADHLVRDRSIFAAGLVRAGKAAAAGHLVLIGISPAEPNEGYGYIRRGEPVGGFRGNVFIVDCFTEKPDAETAKARIAEGCWFWNSGMLVAKASVLAAELAHHAPAVWEAAGKALEASAKQHGAVVLDRASFARSPDISLDYAVLEKTDRTAVLPAFFSWSDLGSWNAFWSSVTSRAWQDRYTGAAPLIDSPVLRAILLHAPPNGTLSRCVSGTRGECWLVTRESAKITLAGELHRLGANGHLAVPSGQAWRAEGDCGEPLHLLELRFGAER